MKTICVLLMMCSCAWAGSLSDLFPTKTPTPTVTPIPTPIETTIPVDPTVPVPNEKGVVLLIKSILLRPDGVCFVVVYPTAP